MKQLYLLLLFYFLYPVISFTQTDSNAVQQDTLKKDTAEPRPKPIIRAKDTTRKIEIPELIADSSAIKDSIRVADSLQLMQHSADSTQRILAEQKAANPILKEGERRIFIGKEWLFYYMVLLLMVFGLLRRAFGKYFYDLFRVFFRTTLKQRQTQEQLLQSPLPSVFMNAFFILSAGLYANFLLYYFQLSIAENFWLQYLYCAGALSSIYIVKFIGLKLTGWLFNLSSATDSYIFIVFIINKMMGIYFLPFLPLLAFAGPALSNAAMIISWFGIALLLIYRFILSYGAIRKEVKLNSFHFILYILGFEVIPLLLIYKLLLVIF